MNGAGLSSFAAPGGSATPANTFALLISNQGETIAPAQKSGTGDSLSGGPSVALSDAAAVFTSDDNHQRINIAGASNANNNGNFPVTGFTSATLITLDNSLGVAEPAYAGTWTQYGKYSQLNDQSGNGRNFSQATVALRSARTLEFSSFPAIGRNPSAGTSLRIGYANAAVSGFQGQDICFTCRARHPGAGLTISEIGDGTAFNRFRFGSSGAGEFTLPVSGGGGSTTLTSSGAGIPSNTWVTLGWKLNFAAFTLSYFINGVLIGTSAAGTARNPTGLSQMSFAGWISVSSTAEQWATAGAWGWGWSAADFLYWHNYFLAQGVP